MVLIPAIKLLHYSYFTGIQDRATLGSDPSGVPDSTGAVHGVALFYAPVETQSVKPRGQGAEPLGV